MGDFGPTGNVRQYIYKEQQGGVQKFARKPTAVQSADANYFIPANEQPIKPLTFRQGASRVVIKPTPAIGQSLENVFEPVDMEMVKMRQRAEQDRMLNERSLKTATKVRSRGIMEALGDFLDAQIEKDKMELATKTAGMTEAMRREQELKNLSKWSDYVSTQGDPNKARSKLQEFALEGLNGVARQDATDLLDQEIAMQKRGHRNRLPEGQDLPANYNEVIENAEERVEEREAAAQRDMDEAEGFRNDMEGEGALQRGQADDVLQQDDEQEHVPAAASGIPGGDTPQMEMRARMGMEDELPSSSMFVPQSGQMGYAEDDAEAEIIDDLEIIHRHGGARETTTFGKVGKMDYEERSRNIYREDGTGFGNQGVSRAGLGTGGGGGGGAQGGGGPMATAQREEMKRGRGAPKKRIPGKIVEEVRKMIIAGSPIRTISRNVGGITEYQVRRIRDQMQSEQAIVSEAQGDVRRSQRKR